MQVALVNDIVLNGEVFVDELAAVGVVGDNTTHLGSCQKDILGFFGFEESRHGALVGKVEFTVRACDKVGVAACFEAFDNGAAYLV